MTRQQPEAQSRTVRMARAEAAAWITRLHGPNRSEEMEQGFRRWLASRPENAAEFEGLTEIWDLTAGGIAARGAPRMQRWQSNRRMPRWAQAAVFVMIFALGGLAASWVGRGPTYSTAIGEQRVVRLPDGSKVSLNSDTQVRVKYSDSRRRLVLERGEAFFEVNKDARRPFAVIAGEREVIALGTAFVVRYEPDRTSVTLMEGKVTVRELGESTTTASEASEPPSRVLQPGQRLVMRDGETQRLDRPDLDAVIAWRRGEVLLEDTPLRDAVAEMNRYDKAVIVIDSDSVAALNISGLYHTGDNRGFAEAVARMHRLQMVEREQRIHLKK